MNTPELREEYTKTASELQEEYAKILSLIESFILDCEIIIGNIAPDVRKRVTQILEQETPLIAGRLIAVEKSKTPEEDMIHYMAEVLKLFKKSIQALSLNSDQIKRFQPMYQKLKEILKKNITDSPVLKMKTPEEIEQMIKTAVVNSKLTNF